jgi:hypothetical protein
VTTIETTSVHSALQMIAAKDANETGVILTTTMETAARETIGSSIVATAEVHRPRVADTVATGVQAAGVTMVRMMRATTKHATTVRAPTTQAADSRVRIRMAAAEVEANPDGGRAAARASMGTLAVTCMVVAVRVVARAVTTGRGLAT